MALKPGDKFNFLTVLPEREMRRSLPYVKVRCDCGTVKWVLEAKVRLEEVKSCGCYRKAAMRERALKHGMESHRLYKSWQAMMARCYDPKVEKYARYGMRGIKVCDRWHDVKVFCEDLESVIPVGMSMDRVNNDGDYEPGNVRAATPETQANNKSNNVNIEYQGRTQTLAQWVKELGLSYTKCHQRLHTLGWSPEKTFTKP